MMDINRKRELDSQLTSSFLTKKSNMNIVKEMVKMLGEKMNNRLTLQSPHFYLKGGNSISLLENQPFTGDFDFQLSLDKEAYQDIQKWKKQINDIDQILRDILKEICKECKKNDFVIEDSFDNIKIDYTADQFSTGYMLIGKSYLEETYSDIISKINLQKGETRLNINKNEIESQTKDSKSPQPMWYVNYTIPGFILYRIVLRRAYKKGNEIEHLKSEIIDISIPRYGSNEVYMSQEGVITHFCEVSTLYEDWTGFKVPGWGYHFYENLNLLQEIELGISGSKHKKEKREKRGKNALDHLLQNNERSLTKIILDDSINESKGHNILGFLAAHLYNIDSYGVLDGELIGNIKEKIKKFYKAELNAVPISENQENLFLNLVKFQTKNNVLNNMITFEDLTSEIKKLEAMCLDKKTKPQSYIYNFDIIKSDDKEPIPLRFLVMKVSTANYENIKINYKKNNKDDIIENNNQCSLTLRSRGGTCYLIMAHDLNNNAIKYKQILERTIIQSQRYRLALAYNKMKKEE